MSKKISKGKRNHLLGIVASRCVVCHKHTFGLSTRCPEHGAFRPKLSRYHAHP